MPALSLERKQALENGQTHYFTGRPCSRGHIAKRTVCDNACVICSTEKTRNWRRERNKDPEFKARLARYAANDRLKHPEKYKERMRRFIETRTEEYWLTKRASVYGLSLHQFYELFNKSNGCCYICGKSGDMRGKNHLCIDHCHKSGRVRGILCQTCNKFLGALHDDPELMRRAAAYLEN